jgi:hypothetical protein
MVGTVVWVGEDVVAGAGRVEEGLDVDVSVGRGVRVAVATISLMII